MNEHRNQGRTQPPQAEQKHPDEWQQDLNRDHLAGQNVGPATDVSEQSPTAFHLRKAGLDLGAVADDDLKRVPIVPDGTRLQQGATYVDLRASRREEFTARGDMHAEPGQAVAPKDQVPYEIWNRLIGEEKPGQE